MKKKILTSLFFSLFVFTSCKKNMETERPKELKEIIVKNQGIDGHTSINTLDWEGTYEGTLPCKDCDGIFTELTLNNNESFVLHQTKIIGDKKGKTSHEGLYQWDESGSKISFVLDKDTIRYKVGENKLVLLNSTGNAIPETDTQKNTLIKKVAKEINNKSN